MAMTPAIDVLLDARALLARPNGWTQNTEMSPRPEGGWAYCLQGAIEAAGGRLVRSSPAMRRVEDVLQRMIPVFNDEPGRKQSDVLAALDQAIAAEWRGDPVRTYSALLDHPPTSLGPLLLQDPPDAA